MFEFILSTRLVDQPSIKIGVIVYLGMHNSNIGLQIFNPLVRV